MHIKSYIPILKQALTDYPFTSLLFITTVTYIFIFSAIDMPLLDRGEQTQITGEYSSIYNFFSILSHASLPFIIISLSINKEWRRRKATSIFLTALYLGYSTLIYISTNPDIINTNLIVLSIIMLIASITWVKTAQNQKFKYFCLYGVTFAAFALAGSFIYTIIIFPITAIFNDSMTAIHILEAFIGLLVILIGAGICVISFYNIPDTIKRYIERDKADGSILSIILFIIVVLCIPATYILAFDNRTIDIEDPLGTNGGIFLFLVIALYPLIRTDKKKSTRIFLIISSSLVLPIAILNVMSSYIGYDPGVHDYLMNNAETAIYLVAGLIIALFIATGTRFSGKLFIPAIALASIYLIDACIYNNKHTIEELGYNQGLYDSKE